MTKQLSKYFELETFAYFGDVWNCQINLYTQSGNICELQFQTDRMNPSRFYGLTLEVRKFSQLETIAETVKELKKIERYIEGGFDWHVQNPSELIRAIERAGFVQATVDRRTGLWYALEDILPETAEVFYPVIDGEGCQSYQVLAESEGQARRLITDALSDYMLNKWSKSGAEIWRGNSSESAPDVMPAIEVLANRNPFIF